MLLSPEKLEKFVEANQGLVGAIADFYATRLYDGMFGGGLLSKIEWCDLKQAGNLGLLKAVREFDEKRNMQFSTCAVPYIRKEIRLFIIKSLIVGNLRGSHLKKATTEEMARYADQSSRRIKKTEKFNPETRKDLWDDILGGSNPVLRHKQNQSEKQLVKEFLSGLEPREKEIFTMLFGLEDGQERSMAEIGRALNLTRERVRQIVDEVLGKFRIENGIEVFADKPKEISPSNFSVPRKLKVVKLRLEEKKSFCQIQAITGLNRGTIYQWVQAYKARGVEGLAKPQAK